jgi:hypothetical protein
MIRDFKWCRPVWSFHGGSFRIGLCFDVIRMMGTSVYCAGIYLPFVTCVLAIKKDK